MTNVGVKHIVLASLRTFVNPTSGLPLVWRTCHFCVQRGSCARKRVRSPMARLTQAIVKKANLHPSIPTMLRWPAKEQAHSQCRATELHTKLQFTSLYDKSLQMLKESSLPNLATLSAHLECFAFSTSFEDFADLYLLHRDPQTWRQ